MNYDPLFLSPQWLREYHTKYPHGMSVLENIIEWLNQVNVMVDKINLNNDMIEHLAEKVLPENVTAVLDSWLADGTLGNVVITKIENNIPHYSVLDYGVKKIEDDAILDNAPAINSLAASLIPGETLYFPDASGYIIKDTVQIPPGVNVIMDAEIRYDGPHDRPAIIYGAPGIRSGAKRLRFSVTSVNQSDWTNSNYVGVRLYNIQNCPDLRVDVCNKFTIGLEAIGSGQGFVYNKMTVASSLGNQIAMLATNENKGWFNENEVNLLSVLQYSGVNTGKSRYGFKLTSRDLTYVNNNKNLVKGSYELKNSVAAPGESIPIILEHGTENKFIDSRDESNGTIFAKVLNDSAYNFFEVSYSTTSSLLQDDSASGYNRIIRSRNILQDNTPFTVLYDSGRLIDKVYDFGSGQKYIQGVHITTSSSSTPVRSQTGITEGSDYVEFSSTRALGRFINTEKVKSFILRTDTVPGYSGRAAVRCYDASGNILDGSLGNYLKYKPTTTFAWNASFGGIYRRGSDASNNMFFKVSDEVKYIDVMIVGGSNPCRLKSFKILGLEMEDASSWCNYQENPPGFTNTISSTPRFVGQIAVTGGLVYIAKGTSAVGDWVQV